MNAVQNEQTGTWHIVATNAGYDPPRSDVIGAVLTSLIESKGISKIRDDDPPQNTGGIGLRYRTSFESKWR